MGNNCLKSSGGDNLDLRMNEKVKKDYYLNIPSQNKDDDQGVGASNFDIREGK